MNWAFLGSGAEHTIIVRDLAGDVTDYVLKETFMSVYQSFKGAKVVTNRITGCSKGYGFVRFGDEREKQRAMTEMNGVVCSTRPMRVGPAANKKPMTSAPTQTDSYQSSQGSQGENDPNNTTDLDAFLEDGDDGETLTGELIRNAAMEDAILPTDILIRILTILPAKSIQRFKFVSKRWCDFLCSPEFIQLYRGQFSIDPNNQSVIVYVGKRLTLIDLHSKERPKKSSILDFPRSDAKGYVDLIACCSGLICVVHTGLDWIFFWNPAMDMYQHVRISSRGARYHKDKGHRVSLGLGYDAKEKDFKIVRIAHPYIEANLTNLDDFAEVYSVNSNDWTSINIDLYFTILEGRQVVCVKGNPYWLSLTEYDADYGTPENSLVYFDVKYMFFKIVSLPPNFSRMDYTSLVDWSDNLGYIQLDKRKGQSFAKVYVLEDVWTCKYIVGPIEGTVEKFLGCLENGDILFYQDGKCLAFDRQSNTSKEILKLGRRKFAIYGYKANFERIIPHAPRPPPPSPVAGDSRKNRGFPSVNFEEVVWPSCRNKGLSARQLAQSVPGPLLQDQLVAISQLARDQEHPDVILPLQPPDTQNCSTRKASLSLIHDILHDEIDSFCKQVAAENLIKKPYINWAVERVARPLQVLWPRSTTITFGSNATGLCLPSSDVDLVVCLPPVRNLEPINETGILEGRSGIKETCLQHAARYLANQEWVKNDSLKIVENTAMPIIVLVVEVPCDLMSTVSNIQRPKEEADQLSCAENDHFQTDGTSKIKNDTNDGLKSVRIDISFKSPTHSGLQTTGLVKDLTERFPAVKPLALVLKQFLADRSLDQSYSGGLSSYCLILLITSFLQHEHHHGRPTNQNYGSLLMDFLYFFGNVFEPRQMRISVQGNGVYLNREHEGSIDPLCIDDPLFLTNNVGHQCIKAFADAYAMLENELTYINNDDDTYAEPNRKVLPKLIPSIGHFVGS